MQITGNGTVVWRAVYPPSTPAGIEAMESNAIVEDIVKKLVEGEVNSA